MQVSPPSRGQAFELPAVDGYPLGATLFEPDGPPAGVVIVNGATAVKQRYYAAFAADLARRGVLVLTYDYRGVGASRPASLRGFEATMLEWARLDFTAVLRHVAKTWPDLRRGVVGHSFGGQALALTPEAGTGPTALDAVATVAAQLGANRHWTGLRRLRIQVLFHTVVPLACHLCGYLPGRLGLGESLPKGVALEWGSWCLHPGYLFSLIDGAAETAERLRVPWRALSFSDDSFATLASVEALHARFPNAEIVHRHATPRELGFESVGHFGFFRSSYRGLWEEIGPWMLEQLSASSRASD